MVALALVAAAVGALQATAPQSVPAVLPSLASEVVAPPTIGGAPPIAGELRAPGGAFLYDARGRVIFLHGVNVVYKHPPFEVFPAPGKPWNFDAHDASLIARLGFNLVRLGIIWRGLEPGIAPSNTPSICTVGPPGDPHQYVQSVLDAYLARVKRTVDLLGRFHVYTMLDMHQDVFNEQFDGEGAPNWAVCTDGAANVDPPGRWSRNYGTAAAGAAYRHFWTNDVVGDLQGQFDMVWGKVAAYFAGDPWIVGYDPFNEPFSASLVRTGDEHFDAQLECFYTGSLHAGDALGSTTPLTCPKGTPLQGVVPTILANDPRHLVFDEPDNYASRGLPTFLGPMDLPNLVYNVHIYCGARSPKTGNPTRHALSRCIAQERRAITRRSEDRKEMASERQPGGPAWIVSEFGATSDASLVADVVSQANRLLVGWAYWAWKYYADPTGSAAEGVVMADGRLRSTARVLAWPYPEAIGGVPTRIFYDPTTRTLAVSYKPARQSRSPTVIVVPARVDYPRGFCVRVEGGSARPVSARRLVLVTARPDARSVRIVVHPGHCSA